MELSELKKLLRESGVVGAGGAGFPTYAKLTDKADTLILNCAECEPLLRLHQQLLEKNVHEILKTMDVMLEAMGAEKGIIAVKAHYKKTVEALEYEIGEHPKLEIRRLDAIYPAGDELILIQRCTGRQVKPGNLPITVGVTVSNVETVYNISQALKGKPVTSKYVTVGGEVKNPQTLCVPIGTEISELITAVGGSTTENYVCLSGGPMMGKIVSERSPVTKTTNAILVLPENHQVVMNKTRSPKISLKRAMAVCCQCMTCTDLCSRHLLGYPVEPHMVMRVLSNGGKGDASVIAGAMFCSGCGLCETYACPQSLSPRAMIDEIKAVARKNGIKPPQGMIAKPIDKDAPYREVSVKRLTSRLGLTKYDVPAPMTDGFKTNRVTVLFSQHIGVPARPTVKMGEKVKAGQTIAEPDENALGVCIHASISGKVSEITDKYLVIE